MLPMPSRPLLFDEPPRLAEEQALGPGAVVLRDAAAPFEAALWADLQALLVAAPWRHMMTTRGFRMSVAMSNCGTLGWVSDRSGYRYDTLDPDSGLAWPALPASFKELACSVAARAGFRNFEPDACLVNRYEPGARLSLHQDRNERDLAHPIVSVSLGLPARFLFGGLHRSDTAARIPLFHRDVVVWGGPARLRYHGVLPLPEGEHSLTGRCRINLTLRKAG